MFYNLGAWTINKVSLKVAAAGNIFFLQYLNWFVGKKKA